MTDLSNLTHNQLAEHIRSGLLEAEARLEADGSHPVALRRVKGAHDLLDAAAQRLAGGGVISPMSVGGDKT